MPIKSFVTFYHVCEKPENTTALIQCAEVGKRWSIRMNDRQSLFITHCPYCGEDLQAARKEAE